MRDQAFETVLTGEVQGGTTAARMPDVPCSVVKIKARQGNNSNVYIGTEDVQIPNAQTDEVTGYELDANEDTGWIPIDNLNKLWMVTDANADDVVYIALR